MSKFFGTIGFVKTEERSPGIHVETPIERQYYGDVVKNVRRWSSTEHLNDDLTINNQFSIVADKFAHENLGAIRYIKFLGIKWKVDSVDIQYPRLILTTGGEYNG